jgi:hypothetical protein
MLEIINEPLAKSNGVLNVVKQLIEWLDIDPEHPNPNRRFLIVWFTTTDSLYDTRNYTLAYCIAYV